MPDQYNFIAELGFGGFAFLILFLMLYTKPRKTKIYFINFLGITVSIITTALHLFLIYMSSSPKTYAMPFFDTICILFLIFYIILVSLIFNYIMLLSPSLGISLKKILTIEAVYSSIYIIIMYILLCKDMLYKTTSSGIEFTTFFYSYIIIGILSASYCLWTTIHNQKHLAKTIVMCVYIFVPVDIILLVLQLFCIMLNKVCHTIKKLEGKYDFDAITVNCSTIEMPDNNLHNELLGIIKDNHIECSKVRFELTESAMINDHDAVTSNMEILHNAGIRFYLDDFGTGYSNLERIITLPFMTIKFDKSILYKALNDEDINEIVSSMVNIFKKKGLVLLVEGVENDEHNEYSIQHGFDYIQGYKYARPVPIAELEEYFEVSF